MIFKRALANQVVAGTKTQTRRLVSISHNPRSPWSAEGCKYEVGKDYAVCPGRGKRQVCRIRITSVTMQHLGDISEADARAEGFDGRADFLIAFAYINGLDRMPLREALAIRVWALEFQALCPNCGELRHQGSSSPLHPCHDCPDPFHGPTCPSCGYRRTAGPDRDRCKDKFHPRRS